jgi:ribosomal protein S18 acetylase RimI-like enzyme
MLTFRTAAPLDVADLVVFVNRAYRGESAKLGWTHEADLIDGTRVDESLLVETIESAGVALIMALQNATLVGCYQFEVHKDQSAYVGMVTVEPVRQTGGLGKKLLADAEARAREASCKILKLSVIEDRKELIAYYERRGFKLTGTRLPFHEGDSRHGFPRKKLALLEMVKQL